MKYFLVTTSFVLLTLFGFSQIEEQLKDKISDANFFYYNEEYDKALPIFKEVLEKDPDNANINFKTGRCYQLMPFEAGRSIKYLEKAVLDISEDYVVGSYKERSAPVSALYHLAHAYHMNRYYEEGIEYYKLFREQLFVDDTYNMQVVERQLESCKTAQEISETPVAVEIYNVGNIINTPYADYNPCITADGNTLFFTRLMPEENQGEITSYTQRIFYANRLSEEKWTVPVDITAELETDGKCALVSVNADGTMLILHKNSWSEGGITDINGGILYYSTKANRTDQKWTPIEKFNKNINARGTQTHASISADGNTLYFTSDRRGGYGGIDIYQSNYNEEEQEWGPAMNLGRTINTEHDEETPFILEDGKTLYFSSEGHYNMGGFDNFSSQLLDNGLWSEPVNLGYPINSPDDNTFFAPNGDGTTAFYAQARHEGYFTFGDIDIYELIVPSYNEYANGIPVTVKGQIKFSDLKDVDGSAKILILNKQDRVVKDFKPNIDGTYSVELFMGEYTFRFIRDEYETIEKYVPIERALIEKTIHVNAQMFPKIDDKSKYYTIRNIYFDENEDSLNRSALIEIEKIKQVLIENPSLYIEIRTYSDTSNHGKLARQRMRNTINYLIKNGVEQNRFISTIKSANQIQEYKDNDNTPESSLERLNNRVEIRVLKTDETADISEDNRPLKEVLKKFNRFSVQLFEKDIILSQEQFSDLGNSITVNRALVKPNSYIYYFGEYVSKADAIKALNMAISKGYADAKLIDYFTLNKNTEFTITNPVPYKKRYTIQLQAVDKREVLTNNPILIEATPYKTSDGFYRYTYKEYDALETAQKDLIYVMENGFPNAFIIEVENLKK
ncbi:MAG: OmpA family protein [Bacteroidales bacterium]|jgi:outer membrane protein OmpA-like peptidoglycan-associated protein|nr:OmpA family protein [Bacteroidales bacterium]